MTQIFLTTRTLTILLVAIFYTPYVVNSQTIKSSKKHKLSLDLNNPDTLRYQRVDSILRPVVLNESLPYNTTFADTMFYNPLFLPLVYNFEVLPTDLTLYPTSLNLKEEPRFHLSAARGKIYSALKKNQRMKETRRQLFVQYPLLVQYNLNHLKDISPIIAPEVVAPKQLSSDITDRRSVLNTGIDLEKTVAKRVYWTKTGEHRLQVYQNQFSDNWYAGGNNNFSLMSYHKLQFNYAKNRISWNNTLEWKLSFLRTPADTLHNISITEDLIRYYTTLGVKASSKWSYTFTNEVKTSLFNTYKTNAVKKSSALLSPLYLNAGIGMAYNHTYTSPRDNSRKFTLKLDMAPISFDYTYVGDKEVDETNFGIASGKKANKAFGSTYNVNLSYAHNRDAQFTSRLKYFTSYSRVVVECENRLNFSFTRVLSSTVYIYLRYDDGISSSKKDEKLGYWQYKEMMGFGLSYTW